MSYRQWGIPTSLKIRTMVENLGANYYIALGFLTSNALRISFSEGLSHTVSYGLIALCFS